MGRLFQIYFLFLYIYMPNHHKTGHGKKTPTPTQGIQTVTPTPSFFDQHETVILGVIGFILALIAFFIGFAVAR